jgi:hypothetical protein
MKAIEIINLNKGKNQKTSSYNKKFTNSEILILKKPKIFTLQKLQTVEK